MTGWQERCLQYECKWMQGKTVTSQTLFHFLTYLEHPSKAVSILHSSKRTFRIRKYGANRT